MAARAGPLTLIHDDITYRVTKTLVRTITPEGIDGDKYQG